MKEKREVTLVVIGGKEAKALGSLLSQTLLLHIKDLCKETELEAEKTREPG